MGPWKAKAKREWKRISRQNICYRRFWVWFFSWLLPWIEDNRSFAEKVSFQSWTAGRNFWILSGWNPVPGDQNTNSPMTRRKSRKTTRLLWPRFANFTTKKRYTLWKVISKTLFRYLSLTTASVVLTSISVKLKENFCYRWSAGVVFLLTTTLDRS